MQKMSDADPKSRWPALVSHNLESLETLFPEVFAEGKVDFAILRQLLGDAVDENEEKYGLTWHGKRRARQLALTPSTGTLRPCPEEGVRWDMTQNLMIEGDNLEVLKLLQKSYAGKVKLIYIDPPYNTGKDVIYPDDYRDNIRNYLTLTGQLDGDNRKLSSNTEASGRFHTAWLNMMYPRLKIARELLCREGMICVSVDDAEIANLREIMEEIFGFENLLATVSWEKVHTRKNSSKTFSVSHDYIVIYARNKDTWDRILIPREGTTAYRNPDNDPKGPWKPDPVTAHNPYSANYLITKPNGVVLTRPSGRYWAFSEDTWNAKVEANEVIWGTGSAYPMIKRYLEDVQDGLVPVTLFTRKFAGDTAAAKKEVDALFGSQGVFQYPKPVLLIRRLIQLVVRPHDTVMDFFAGSGTTGHAVMQQNMADDGGRRFILVQLPEPLDPDVAAQQNAAEFCDKLHKPRNVSELTKERLRRAASKIKDGDPDYTGDLGFRVFRLDTSNIRAWDPTPDDLEGALLAGLDHIEPGRTEEDILYELLLKLGLDLCVSIEARTIAGRSVQSVGAGTLITCLDEEIFREDVEPLAIGIADWHDALAPAGEATIVFRDSAFGSDVAKTNLAAILEQRGLGNIRSL